MCKISVIMPSYNVCKYIRECLESIRKQTLDDIEVICVDAFSTDGTREIIQEYVDKDSRFMLINDDKGSCGYSYNKGIDEASGEYIGFVETDDYIADTMFEALYAAAKEQGLDYVKSNYTAFCNLDAENRHYENMGIVSGIPNIYGKMVAPCDMPELLVCDQNMWNGIYRSDFIKKKVRLNESKGAAYQDIGFLVQTLCQAKKAMYIGECMYFYRRDNENASMVNPKGVINLYREFMYAKLFMEKCTGISQYHWCYFYMKLINSGILKKSCGLLELHNGDMSELYDTLENVRKEMITAEKNGYISYALLGNERYKHVRELIKSVREYTDYMNVDFQNREWVLRELLERLKEEKNIVIFGAGNYGKRAFLFLTRNALQDNVTAFCDNDESKQNTKLYGKDILSLNTIIDKQGMPFFVVANERYYMDIVRQLRNACISETNIILYRITGMEW
ncbi:MAG: glycosyltransferase [Lachnospiraceae bacterium]|nr:glycosyltransferase [Lachnospiraceae bacterium]